MPDARWADGKRQVVLTGDGGEHVVHSDSLACQTLITAAEAGNERLNPSFPTRFPLSVKSDEAHRSCRSFSHMDF